MGAAESICEPRSESMCEPRSESSCEPRSDAVANGQQLREDPSAGGVAQERAAKARLTPQGHSAQGKDALAKATSLPEVKQVLDRVSPRRVNFEDGGSEWEPRRESWDRIAALCACSEPTRTRQMLENQLTNPPASWRNRVDAHPGADAIRKKMQPPLDVAPDTDSGNQGATLREPVPEPNMPCAHLTTMELAMELRNIDRKQSKLSLDPTRGWKQEWHSLDSLKSQLKAQMASRLDHEKREQGRARPPAKFSKSSQDVGADPLPQGSFKQNPGKQAANRTLSWHQAAIYTESRKTTSL